MRKPHWLAGHEDIDDSLYLAAASLVEDDSLACANFLVSEDSGRVIVTFPQEQAAAVIAQTLGMLLDDQLQSLPDHLHRRASLARSKVFSGEVETISVVVPGLPEETPGIVSLGGVGGREVALEWLVRSGESSHGDITDAPTGPVPATRRASALFASRGDVGRAYGVRWSRGDLDGSLDDEAHEPWAARAVRVQLLRAIMVSTLVTLRQRPRPAVARLLCSPGGTELAMAACWRAVLDAGVSWPECEGTNDDHDAAAAACTELVSQAMPAFLHLGSALGRLKSPRSVSGAVDRCSGAISGGATDAFLNRVARLGAGSD